MSSPTVGSTTTVEDPLLLTNLPSGLYQIYRRLGQYITEVCSLSVRYVNNSNVNGNIREQVEDCLLNTESVLAVAQQFSSTGGLLDAHGCLDLSKCPGVPGHTELMKAMGSQRIRFIPNLLTRTIGGDVNDALRELFDDDYSVCKIIGYDVVLDKKKSPQKVMVPLWGIAFAASEGDRFQDREIKFVFMDPRFEDQTLETVFLVHSIIEAAYWCPNVNVPPSKDDNKRMVSCMVDDNLVLFPLRTVVMLESLGLFEQHFEDNERAHNPVGCSCSRYKTYAKSFLLKKVSSLRNVILNKSAGEAGDFIDPLVAQGRPPTYLHIFLQLLHDHVTAMRA